MARVFALTSAFLLICSTAFAAEERKTIEKEYTTADGKVTATFNYAADYVEAQNDETALILARPAQKQGITLVSQTLPQEAEGLTAETVQKGLIQQLTMMGQTPQFDLEFVKKGKSYSPAEGVKALSVIFSFTVKDPQGEAVVKVRGWTQFTVHKGRLFLMAGEWNLKPDTVEGLEMTTQERIEKLFDETFKSFKLQSAG